VIASWPPEGYVEAPCGGLVPIPDAVETNGHRRTSWTATELLEETFPDPRFAVVDLLPEGLAFMCGAPKLGKSWLGLGVGIAVAAGGRALGKVPVEPGPVLYLALEDSPRRLQSRLRTLLGEDGAPEGLHLETEWPRLDNGGADRIDDWLEANPSARLVLIDVWPRIRARADRRTDHFQSDYDAASQLQALATSRGVAIVALFHTRKAEAEDFVETVSGTFGTAAAADTIIVVKRSRGQADATLHVTGRDVSEQELALRFDAQVGTWSLMGDAAEYAIGESRKVILDAVKDHGSLTPKQASDVTGLSHDLCRQTMPRMLRDGQLVAERGSYRPPVTPVTPSLDEVPGSDTVTAVTGPQRGVAHA
jgi:hypothetical protein